MEKAQSTNGDNPPRTETKSQAKVRLIEEDRWQKEAMPYREELIAAGLLPNEAWGKMIERFQPLDGTRTIYKPPPSGYIPPRYRPLPNGDTPVDFKADVAWVYQNLEANTVKNRAPSIGALTLFKWAKKNPEDFLTTFVVKLLPSKAEAKSPDREQDEHEDIQGHVEKLATWRKQNLHLVPPPGTRCPEGMCRWVKLRNEAIARGWTDGAEGTPAMSCPKPGPRDPHNPG